RSFEIKKGVADAVCLSRDGRHALVGLSKKTELWETATGHCLRTFAGHEWGVRSVSFSADGRRVVSADSQAIKLWELSTGQCVQTVKGFRDVTLAALSADARFILGVCYDTPALWDAATGRLLRKFESPSPGWTHSACLSADGRHLLSGSDDR